MLKRTIIHSALVKDGLVIKRMFPPTEWCKWRESKSWRGIRRFFGLRV